MKRISFILIVLSLVTSMLYAAPGDDDVTATFSGVFTVFATSTFATMTGMPVEGVSIDMDMESQTSKATFTDIDVDALFAMFGNIVPTSGEVPEVPFKFLSGTVTMHGEDDMVLDLTFTGGPVRSMTAELDSSGTRKLVADGRDFSYLGEEELFADFED